MRRQDQLPSHRRSTGSTSKAGATSTSEEATERKLALRHRLKDVVVWELSADASRPADCRRMTLRGLYEHVIDSIKLSCAEACADIQKKTPAPDGDTKKKKGGPKQKPLGGYIHPRDLRKIVTPLSVQNEPEIMVRRHVILMNLDHLKAIIIRNRILVPVPDGNTSALIDLERRIRRGCEDSILDDSDSEKGSELQAPPTEKAPRSESVAVTAASKQSSLHPADHEMKGDDATAVIGADDAFGSSSHHAASTARGEDVMKQIEDVADILEEFDEWDYMDQSQFSLPFELQCVDAVLQSNVLLLSQDIVAMSDEVYDVTDKLLAPHRSSVEVERFRDNLRRAKNAVEKMTSLVEGFNRALQQILNEDEDMALVNLSRLISHSERFMQPVSAEMLEEESDEPELIFEAYLQSGLTAMNAMLGLKSIISNTDELLNTKLDVARNRLLYVNTVMGLLSFLATTGSLIGSFFGMNLKSGLEDEAGLFQSVITWTMVGLAALCLVLVMFFVKIGAFGRI